jgi:ERCC4-type nuclease
VKLDAPYEIAIDSREQTPWQFPADVPTVRKKLDAGDYSIVGLESKVAIERKSLGDLVGTLTKGRERFERELDRLATYERKVIVVEGALGTLVDGLYRSTVSPNALLGSLGSFFARWDIATIFAGNARCGAALAGAYLRKCAKHLRSGES